MRVAALDLGSNTFLLLIADVHEKQLQRVICDETRIVKLAQGVQSSGVLHADALARAEKCFREYAALIKTHKVERIVAVATSAARDAKNGKEFLALGEQYGIPIQIISGQEEARITFLGSTFDQLEAKKCIVIDVGGGSTEIIGYDEEEQSLCGMSVNVGSVRLTEMFITKHPVSRSELAKLHKFAEQEFVKVREVLPNIAGQRIVVVAGTPTSLACLDHAKEYEECFVHGHMLSRQRLQYWTTELAKLSVEEREKLPGMPPKRSEVLVAGTSILDAAIGVLGGSEAMVSTKGVRYGLALSWEQFQ